jgi:hypothetical protein
VALNNVTQRALAIYTLGGGHSFVILLLAAEATTEDLNHCNMHCKIRQTT